MKVVKMSQGLVKEQRQEMNSGVKSERTVKINRKEYKEDKVM